MNLGAPRNKNFSIIIVTMIYHPTSKHLHPYIPIMIVHAIGCTMFLNSKSSRSSTDWGFVLSDTVLEHIPFTRNHGLGSDVSPCMHLHLLRMVSSSTILRSSYTHINHTLYPVLTWYNVWGSVTKKSNSLNMIWSQFEWRVAKYPAEYVKLIIEGMMTPY